MWTAEQLGRFLDASAPHRLYALFHLIAMSGLRRGEAIGLHWADTDLGTAHIIVRVQVIDTGHGVEFGPPKTKSGTRVVALDAGTVAILVEYRSRQRAEQLLWGSGWVDDDLVFARENGERLRPDYVSHLFQRLVSRADVPRIRLHDLRHTNASLALAAGVALKAVSDRLGHSSTAITADLYTQVLPTVAREAAERIAAQVPRNLPMSTRDLPLTQRQAVEGGAS